MSHRERPSLYAVRMYAGGGEGGGANEKLPVHVWRCAAVRRNVLIYSRPCAGIMCHTLCYSCRDDASKINVKHSGVPIADLDGACR